MVTEREERRRVRAQRDADANTHEPADGLEGPARPGTTETGRPDRDQIGEGDRQDLAERIAGDYEPPRAGRDAGVTADFSDEQAMERARPSAEMTHRQDRKELTGQRAQGGARSGETETDTQGSQQTRDHIGLETEPQRGGRVVPAGSDQERRRDGSEAPRGTRRRRSEKEIER